MPFDRAGSLWSCLPVSSKEKSVEAWERSAAPQAVCRIFWRRFPCATVEDHPQFFLVEKLSLVDAFDLAYVKISGLMKRLLPSEPSDDRNVLRCLQFRRGGPG